MEKYCTLMMNKILLVKYLSSTSIKDLFSKYFSCHSFFVYSITFFSFTLLSTLYRFFWFSSLCSHSFSSCRQSFASLRHGAVEKLLKTS